MPPTLVRPQTFTVFQQPDSASPAVRIGIRTKYYMRTSPLFSLRPSGVCKSIALSAFPRSTELPAPLAVFNQISSRLGFLFRLRRGWVNDQSYDTTFQLHKQNWRREFLSACRLGFPQTFIRHSFAKKR